MCSCSIDLPRTRSDSAAGKLRGFTKVARDITERKLSDEALSEARATLERRVAERRVDVLQHGVPVGAVDDRVVLGAKRQRVSDRRERELRRDRLAVDLHAIEPAVEASACRQNS